MTIIGKLVYIPNFHPLKLLKNWSNDPQIEHISLINVMYIYIFFYFSNLVKLQKEKHTKPLEKWIFLIQFLGS